MSNIELFELLALVLVSALLGACLEHLRAQWAWRRWRKKNGYGKINGYPKFSRHKEEAGFDSAAQLRSVMTANFEARPLLSPAEARVLYAAEDAIRETKLRWRAMGQVSLGEVLRSRDGQAYAAINSKRVDILLISNTGNPMIAIEYQGEGHYQGTAAARDAVKKEALRKAGVRYLEVTPEDDLNELKRAIVRIASSIKDTAETG
jgi:uncharacterized protein DUF2726